MPLPEVNPLTTVAAAHYRKLVYLLSGKLGDHQQQVSLTGFDDGTTGAFALKVRNRGAGGQALQVLDSGGTLPLLQVYDSETQLFNLRLAHQSAPVSVAAGKVALYAKTDNLLYWKSSAGIETAVNGVSYGKNYLVNPGLEVWSRGAGPFGTTGDWTADKWQLTEGAGATTTIARAAGSDGASEFAAAWTQSAAGAASILKQSVEGATRLRLKTVTFSMRVKSSYTGCVALTMTDGTTTATSLGHTGGGGYETLSCTLTVAAAATTLTVTAVLAATGGAHSGEMDSAVLSISSSAIAYEPPTAADDHLACRRFYQALTMQETGRSYDGSATWIVATRSLAPPMSVQTTPTVTSSLAVTTMAGAGAGFTLSGTTATGTGDAYGYTTVTSVWTKAATNTENAQLAGGVIVEIRA